MLDGIIMKGIGGFYYVKTDEGIYECRARGLFRKQKIKPLIGDKVCIEVTQGDKTGYIKEIKKRMNELIRPTVANVSQAVIVFAIKNPDPNLWLLDRFLLVAEEKGLNVLICINKIDLSNEKEISDIINIYEKAGYKVIVTSCKQHKGIEELKVCLKDNITVFAGPSGVGKSSILNSIQPKFELKTGDISQKTNRGKHTTRSAELMELSCGGLVVDTPGFSSLDISNIDENGLKEFYREIKKFGCNCRFNSCMHKNEPDCGVKEALEEGKISKERYESYLNLMDEISKRRRY
ncbi:ribosome small subunit-dependent GTPase A [Abyssisolibacter fermentans]|uniref:ribosome small subunit-dependent GTPase A n=1 Tax=Abyssisolibacter fermentans TaxID=1766203 RepID=UPI000833B716|nr:ribosome small subunit-dependent GTPase A [Abyssisolibacter fermentans]